MATALILLAPLASQANEVCGPLNEAGVQNCKAGLDAAQVLHMRASQEKSQWCWAATIAIVFRHHGFAVAQEEIVRWEFGDSSDRGVTAPAITQMLQRSWQDRQGRAFHASATAGDAPARRFMFENDTVIRELVAQRPMIVGALGHAMVLVQVEYERFTQQGAMRITGAIVIDPMPGRGIRRLTPVELSPTYVAAVHVAAQEQVASASTGGAGAQ